MKLEFPRKIPLQILNISNFMKIRSVATELYHADMTKLTVIIIIIIIIIMFLKG